jgi:glycosyltransferase involved in cell wall biosynthesis
MRLLLTTISLDGERGGGTAHRTNLLASHLRALGAEVEVLAIEGGGLCDDLRSSGVPVHTTGAIRLRFQFPLLDMRALRRLVGGVDVVHVLGYWNMLSVAVAATARRGGIPYVLSAAGEFAALARPRLDQRAFHTWFGRRMIAGASSLVAITQREREDIISSLAADPDKVVVVSNGIDPPVQGGDDERLPRRRFVLFLGRLAPIKGPDLLLDAFASVAAARPDVDLVFAGPDFGMRAWLEQRAQSLGLAERIVFIGYADDVLRRNAYARAELVVVPSRAEAMSLVALEAGAAGRPVLLTDQCGFDEVDEFGGRVVPASVEGIGRGLSELLTHDADLAGRGRRLRAFVLERFAWPRVAGLLLAHMEGLVREHRAR